MNYRKFLMGIMLFSIYLNQPLYAITLNKGTNPFSRAAYAVGIAIALPFAYAYSAIHNAVVCSNEMKKKLDILENMEEIFRNINANLCLVQKVNLLHFINKAKEVGAIHLECYQYRELLKKDQITVDLVKEETMISMYKSKYKELCELRAAFMLKQTIIQDAMRHYNKITPSKIDGYTVDRYFSEYSKALVNHLAFSSNDFNKGNSLILNQYYLHSDMQNYMNKLVLTEKALQTY